MPYILFPLWLLFQFSFFYSVSLRIDKKIPSVPKINEARAYNFNYIQKIGNVALLSLIIYLTIYGLLGWEFRWHYVAYVFYGIIFLVLDRYLIAVNYNYFEEKGKVPYVSINLSFYQLRIETRFLSIYYFWARGIYTLISIFYFLVLFFFFNPKFAFKLGVFKPDDLITMLKPPPEGRKSSNDVIFDAFNSFSPIQNRNYFKGKVIMSYRQSNGSIENYKVLFSRRRIFLFKEPAFYTGLSALDNIEVTPKKDTLFLSPKHNEYITKLNGNGFSYRIYSKERVFNDTSTYKFKTMEEEREKYKLQEQINF